MPFLEHFGFTERPFALTPNCELYYPSEAHQAVLRSLAYAIQRGEGIVKVSGEVGTGKTLLCRLLIAALIESKTVAYIINPQDDSDWVVGAVCREFGLDPDGPGDPFHRLNAFLLEQFREGRSAVLMVDEAQALGTVGLETVRRLSNLETDTSKLLQIILFGQPELDRLLQTHALRQLNQRIVFSFTIRPLSTDTAIDYVRYRVRRSNGDVGAADRLFESPALRAIARAARGIPRLINIVADKSLLAAYCEGATQVQRRHVREAVADSIDVIGGRWGVVDWNRTALLVAPTVGAAVVLGAIGWWAIDGGGAGIEWSLTDSLSSLFGRADR